MSRSHRSNRTKSNRSSKRATGASSSVASDSADSSVARAAATADDGDNGSADCGDDCGSNSLADGNGLRSEVRAASEHLVEKLIEWTEQLQAFESHVGACSASSDSRDSSDAELRERYAQLERRFEASQATIDELQRENQALVEKLEDQRQGVVSEAPHGEMSWEERKASTLRHLEALDDQDNGGANARHGLEIQQVIQQSEREIQSRDQEIAQLQYLLQEQSAASGELAIGGAAVLQMLDQDELIQQERDKLQQIQQQWEEKLREAEIEISMERARLARERIELEQRMIDLQQQDAIAANEENKGQRWLTRLGLAD